MNMGREGEILRGEAYEKEFDRDRFYPGPKRIYVWAGRSASMRITGSVVEIGSKALIFREDVNTI